MVALTAQLLALEFAGVATREAFVITAQANAGRDFGIALEPLPISSVCGCLLSPLDLDGTNVELSDQTVDAIGISTTVAEGTIVSSLEMSSQAGSTTSTTRLQKRCAKK